MNAENTPVVQVVVKVLASLPDVLRSTSLPMDRDWNWTLLLHCSPSLLLQLRMKSWRRLLDVSLDGTGTRDDGHPQVELQS